jgi:hypothetical protein
LSDYPEVPVFPPVNRDVRDFRDVMTTLTVLTALNRNIIPDSGGHLRTFAVMSGLDGNKPDPNRKDQDSRGR